MANGVTGYFDLFDDSYGITLRVHYSETYDIASNESTVAITKLQVKCSAYYGITHYLNGEIKINDKTAVSMSSSAGTHGVTISQKNTFYDVGGTLGSVSGITHNADGSGSVVISVSVKAFQGGSSGSKWDVSGNNAVVLTTIPRASSLSVSDGTLGTAQTLKVTRQSTSFSHTITYACGSASGTICTRSTSESISFTPPIELARQNPSSTNVAVTFTLQTYSGTTAIASPISVTVVMAIPASIKPGCSLSVEDATGNFARFGGYVQGQSKLDVSISGTPAYDSPIISYKASANGDSYTQQSFTTGALKSSGSQTVSATVTDQRGRTSEQETVDITVLPYSPPFVSALAVHRCNADGTENSIGSYAKVTYSFEITSLSNKNTKIVTLKYKKSADSEYTSVTLPSVYSAVNASYVFAADDGSSYDIVLVLADTFTSSQRGTSVSTAGVIMHFRADGKGMGMGKVSEKSNALDMGWDIELNEKNLLRNGFAAFSNVDILWENPSTGSFSAQTVSVDLTGYSLIFVVAKTNENALTNTLFLQSSFVPNIVGAQGMVGGMAGGEEYWAHCRYFTIVSGGISFTSGSMWRNNGTIYTDWDNRSVPVYICGIKGLGQ